MGSQENDCPDFHVFVFVYLLLKLVHSRWDVREDTHLDPSTSLTVTRVSNASEIPLSLFFSSFPLSYLLSFPLPSRKSLLKLKLDCDAIRIPLKVVVLSRTVCAIGSDDKVQAMLYEVFNTQIMSESSS